MTKPDEVFVSMEDGDMIIAKDESALEELKKLCADTGTIWTIENGIFSIYKRSKGRDASEGTSYDG